jgi:hypothetical protein
MTAQSWPSWFDLINGHVATITMRAECSCGWNSDQSTKVSDAMAEHAAHVHVVGGLADGYSEP